MKQENFFVNISIILCTDTVVTYAYSDQILCNSIWVVQNLQFYEKRCLRQNLRIY